MCAVEPMLAMTVASGLSWSVSALGHRLGVVGAVALTLRAETLKIDRSHQDFPPASHLERCDTQSAVAVTARRK